MVDSKYRMDIYKSVKSKCCNSNGKSKNAQILSSSS